MVAEGKGVLLPLWRFGLPQRRPTLAGWCWLDRLSVPLKTTGTTLLVSICVSSSRCAGSFVTLGT